jgi:Zn-dependent protease with chaperone function
MDQNQTIRCRYCGQLNQVKAEREGIAVCGRCRLELWDAPHKKFHSLDPHAYVHSLDSQALAALKAVPGVDTILKKFLALTYESYFRVVFMASCVRVNERQYPDLHAKLEIAATTLGIEKPDFFISVSDPFEGGLGFNAFSSGVEKPFMVVNSLLVERLTDEELLSIIAHEAGHIHSQHMLYRTAALILVLLARYALIANPVTAGISALLTLTLQAALLNWYQKSEFSADRAALLVVQNPKVVQTALMKMAGGTLASKVNYDEFVAQARAFEKGYDENVSDKFWTLIAASQTTHPFPVWRVSEIIKWVEEGEYRKVLEQQT